MYYWVQYTFHVHKYLYSQGGRMTHSPTNITSLIAFCTKAAQRPCAYRPLQAPVNQSRARRGLEDKCVISTCRQHSNIELDPLGTGAVVLMCGSLPALCTLGSKVSETCKMSSQQPWSEIVCQPNWPVPCNSITIRRSQFSMPLYR